MKKTYWKSLEALAETPEFQGSLGKEFPTPPGERQKEDKNGVSRREFLKLMGASMLMASAAACTRRPVEKIIPYLNKPEEVTPGVANWYASTCGECPAACGILAKTREGRPIKLEGNPDHPMSQGGLCARGQASLLNLYDPDRLQGPIKSDGQGGWEAVSWKEVDAAIGKALQEIREKKGNVAILTGSVHSPATQELLHQFKKRFQNVDHYSCEPLSLVDFPSTPGHPFGTTTGVPRYLLDKADYVLSFGADFLDTWLSPVEFTKNFSKKRNVQNGAMSRLVVMEPVPTVTGSNADLHIPVRPGDEIYLALALAHELVVAQKLSQYAKEATVLTTLAPYSVEQVSDWTGIDAPLLRQIAKELWEHRKKGIVLGGGYSLNGARDIELAVHFLNSVLENEGETIDRDNSPSNQSRTSYVAFKNLIRSLKKGEIDLLLIHGVNPLYSFSDHFEFKDLLKTVPVIVSFSERVDETALKAHWVLPTHHYLESWGDAEPQKGLLSLFQPTIAPLYNTRSFQDALLVWSGEEPWHRFLKNYWKENIYKKYGRTSSFIHFWESALRRGVVDTRKTMRAGAPSFRPQSLKSLRLKPYQRQDLSLVLYPTLSQYDGRSSNNSWLQELPDPVTKITWRNYASIAPSKAKELGLREGDIVKIRSAHAAKAELPVHIQTGMHPDAVAVPLGYGHTHFGKVADGVGVNGFHFVTMDEDRVHFVQEISLQKTGKWMKLASTQLHQTLEGRPLIRETTWKAYQKNPHAGNETHHHLPSMWSGHQYEGYHWGMAIDTNVCTGCSACVIACQAENNVPVVGERQVKLGREMHWLRIDRYQSGEMENPEVVHQPMLCQQCDNAPCETVCPTLATIHNEEGLNVQVYNRCVGTRYCANNCPYKVRRFNWFEYLRGLETPLAMVLNPDVSVREKGVMEKCTFCVQRITEGKDKAKDYGRQVADGEIIPACQQSCPADAIIFGDMNNPKSKMAKLKKDPRGYRVLEDLNTDSSVTYLTKVRNHG